MTKELRSIGNVLAHRIRSYRKRRGWSVKALAEECARLGAPQLTEASLTNIERGRAPQAKRGGRDVTVEELVVLGYALAVPPLLLAVPLGENEPVAITSTAAIHPHLAWQVIVGDEAPVVTGRLVTRLQDWSEARLPVLWFKSLLEAQENYWLAEGRLRLARTRGEDETEARAGETAALQGWAKAANRILEGGLRVPGYAAETVEMLTATGAIANPDLLEVYQPEDD